MREMYVLLKSITDRIGNNCEVTVTFNQDSIILRVEWLIGGEILRCQQKWTGEEIIRFQGGRFTFVDTFIHKAKSAYNEECLIEIQ